VFLDGFGEGAEDDAISPVFLESGGYRDAVEYGIHGDAASNSRSCRGCPVFVGAEQFGIHVVEAFRPVDIGFGGGVVADAW